MCRLDEETKKVGEHKNWPGQCKIRLEESFNILVYIYNVLINTLHVHGNIIYSL